MATPLQGVHEEFDNDDAQAGHRKDGDYGGGHYKLGGERVIVFVFLHRPIKQTFFVGAVKLRTCQVGCIEG